MRRSWVPALVAGSAIAPATIAFGEEPAPVSQTTPSTTTPTCVVTGPLLEDRRAAFRTGLPKRQTIIALDATQRAALPDRLPRAVTKRLEDLGARFGPIDEDGSISIKSMWRRDLRRATGLLQVSGQRLDAPTGRFSVDLNPTYAKQRRSNFIPGSLVFSEPGCWQIKARAGKARVTYVALVRPPQSGEFAPYVP